MRHADLDDQEAWDRLCELNVLHQMESLCGLAIIRDAWRDGQELSVHGWRSVLANTESN